MIPVTSVDVDLAGEPREPAPDPAREPRPYYWSVRRELWENRSVVVAPLAAGLVVLVGYVVSTIGLPHRRRALLLLDPAKQRATIEMPYDFAAMALILVAALVGAFYCLDALQGERRDRSLLFWKSLPVSDRTAVLAKASIPLVVLPALAFVVALVTQLLILAWTGLVVLASIGPAGWIPVPLPLHSLVLLYGLLAMALWHAPIYAWLLVVSAWARRAAFLWAVLPPLGLMALERLAFGSEHLGHLLRYRIVGFVEQAFVPEAQGRIETLGQLAPGRYLATPGLWVGLVVAALLLVAAMRLRRSRGPL